MAKLTFDMLLEYLSCLGTGNWLAFKRAVTTVAETQYADGTPRWVPYRIAENLAALGHVEFAFEGKLEWAVAPPTIASLPSAEGHGVLCGARSDALLHDIELATRKAGIHFACSSQDLGPAAVELRAESDDDLEILAGHVGIAFEYSAATSILRALPSLASVRKVASDATFPTLSMDKWNPESLNWSPVEEASGDGAYRVHYWQRLMHIAVTGGVAKYVSRTTAVYTALGQAGIDIANYDAETRQFAVPPNAYPPTLYARVESPGVCK